MALSHTCTSWELDWEVSCVLHDSWVPQAFAASLWVSPRHTYPRGEPGPWVDWHTTLADVLPPALPSLRLPSLFGLQGPPGSISLARTAGHVLWGLLLLSRLDMCSGFPGGSSGKQLACQRRRRKSWGFSPGSGRSPGGGCGHPLQCSRLENPAGRGAWWATVYVAAESWTGLKRPSLHARTVCSPSMRGWKGNENNRSRMGNSLLVEWLLQFLFACLFIFGCTGSSLPVATSGDLLSRCALLA